MEFIILGWIVFVVAVWLVIKKKKPEWLGLGKSRNLQKIDGVQLRKCSKCSEGELEPVFKWWRYFFYAGLPPGFIYIFGRPDKYKCLQCGDETPALLGTKLLTRISLTQRLPKMFIMAIIIQILFAAIAAMIFVKYWFNYQ